MMHFRIYRMLIEKFKTFSQKFSDISNLWFMQIFVELAIRSKFKALSSQVTFRL